MLPASYPVHACVSRLSSFRQMTGAYLAGQDVADDTSGDQAGDLCCVVGRRALHDFHPGDRLAVRDDLKKFQYFAGQEPAWFRPAGSRHEGGWRW